MKVLLIFATFVAISSCLTTKTIENAKVDIKAKFDLVPGSAATALRLCEYKPWFKGHLVLLVHFIENISCNQDMK